MMRFDPGGKRRHDAPGVTGETLVGKSMLPRGMKLAGRPRRALPARGP
jgi:hypothetical protein